MHRPCPDWCERIRPAGGGCGGERGTCRPWRTDSDVRLDGDSRWRIFGLPSAPSTARPRDRIMSDLPPGPSVCAVCAPGDDAAHPAAAPRRSHAALGQVVWHELRTTDVARARSFYSALFGWVVRPASARPDDRGVLYLDGSAVAAVGPLERSDGDSSHWVPFVAVPDVEECCFRAPELRGSVYRSSAERYGIGPAAVLEDPQGAIWAAVGPAGTPAADGAPLAAPAPWTGQRVAGHRGTPYRAAACPPMGYRPPGYRPPGYRPRGQQSPDHGPPAATAAAPAAAAAACAEGRDGAAGPSRAGRIERTLLITPDAGDARLFYGTLLGWRFPETAEERAGGGGARRELDARAGAREVAARRLHAGHRARSLARSWLPCISVAVLGASLEAARMAGATVLLGDSRCPPWAGSGWCGSPRAPCWRWSSRPGRPAGRGAPDGGTGWRMRRTTGHRMSLDPDGRPCERRRAIPRRRALKRAAGQAESRSDGPRRRMKRRRAGHSATSFPSSRQHSHSGWCLIIPCPPASAPLLTTRFPPARAARRVGGRADRPSRDGPDDPPAE